MTLPMSDSWEIEQGRVDSAQFFAALWRHFPDATTFYAEGGGGTIAPEVRECYAAHREEGEYVPRAETLWPRSAKFRCRFSAELMTALSALAERHATPELLDHLALYRGSTEVLSWPDAFGNVMWVSGSVSEEVVAAFAADLGLRYGHAF